MSTICAPATAPGGAMAVIRVSGPEAISITSRIFSKDLTQAKGYTLHYGNILTPENDATASSPSEKNCASADRIIDDVIVSVFRSPHSYTGEDSTEISCHGSRFIVQKIIEALIHAGARMATPGEFTKRAFLAGKMDLSQAEAVAEETGTVPMPTEEEETVSSGLTKTSTPLYLPPIEMENVGAGKSLAETVSDVLTQIIAEIGKVVDFKKIGKALKQTGEDILKGLDKATDSVGDTVVSAGDSAGKALDDTLQSTKKLLKGLPGLGK